eukprot:gene5301-946_t
MLTSKIRTPVLGWGAFSVGQFHSWSKPTHFSLDGFFDLNHMPMPLQTNPACSSQWAAIGKDSWGVSMAPVLPTETEPTQPYAIPTRASHLDHITCGRQQTLAWSSRTGEMVVMGDNRHGQLALGFRSDEQYKSGPLITRVPDTYGRIVKVSSGCTHTILLTESGIAWSVGNNAFGQLGFTSPGLDHVFDLTPISLPSGDAITDIAAGDAMSLFVANGELWGCGRSSTSKPVRIPIVHPETGATHKAVAVAVGLPHATVITSDLTVWSFAGMPELGVQPPSHPLPIGTLPGPLVSINAGNAHTAFVCDVAGQKQGLLYGYNGEGQRGSGPGHWSTSVIPVISGIHKIACGGAFSICAGDGSPQDDVDTVSFPCPLAGKDAEERDSLLGEYNFLQLMNVARREEQNDDEYTRLRAWPERRPLRADHQSPVSPVVPPKLPHSPPQTPDWEQKAPDTSKPVEEPSARWDSLL